jgi:nucleotide-binding universal stress UspA family protein
MKILVGVDGSEHAGRAVEWCAAHATALHAEVLAVHVVDIPAYVTPHTVYFPAPVLSAEQREELRDLATREWCAPLGKANLPFRVVVVDGNPALALMQTAKIEHADLVVVGRRGRGGFAELVLGSTSHALIHHLDRPLVVVP